MTTKISIKLKIFFMLLWGTAAIAHDGHIEFHSYFPDTKSYSPLFSGPTKPTFIAIRSAEEWKAFWGTLNSPAAMPVPPSVVEHQPLQDLKREPEEVPQVDFDRYTLVVAAPGRQFNVRERVKFVSFNGLNRIITVKVQVIFPGKECTVTSSATSPIELALIPKTAKPLKFDVSRMAADCARQDARGLTSIPNQEK